MLTQLPIMNRIPRVIKTMVAPHERELHHVIMTSSVKSCRWRRHKADLCSSSHSSSSPHLANLQSLSSSLSARSPLEHSSTLPNSSTRSQSQPSQQSQSQSKLPQIQILTAQSPSERNDSCFCFFTKGGPVWAKQ